MGYAHLSKSQRLELSILHNKGYSQSDIAKVLNINQSTVSRELKRNSMRNTEEYDPEKAHHKAYVNRKYSKYCGMKISSDRFLEEYVIKGLKEGWTPEQIRGRLKRDYNRTLSFKSIYSWIYSSYGQAYAHLLPSKRYKPKRRKKKKTKRQHIPNRVSIENRPNEITKRKRIGDFEGDTLGKPKRIKETIVGVVDRKSRYFCACKVSALRFSIEGFKQIIPSDAKSLTLDNGRENIRYQELNISTYFCHPYSSWEKASIENTFQRLRRYIPKKADLSKISDKDIASIVKRMNNTPRKCLNYQTPAEVFKEHLHH